MQHHGFLINTEKSHLVPSIDLVHLRARINTVQVKVFLPEDKREKLGSLVRQLRTTPSADLMKLVAIQGLMILTLDMVPWAQFHTRPLQWLLLPYQRDIAR